MSKAIASSGELNFTGWAGYPAMMEKVFQAFTAATGIMANFTEQPDQDTMFAAAKVAVEAGGIDMIELAFDRWGGWNSNGLLSAWDQAKLAMDNWLPGLADGAAGIRSHDGDNLMHVPSNRGTESRVYKTDTAVLGDPPSLGALFDPANQAVVHPHSALAAMGRIGLMRLAGLALCVARWRRRDRQTTRTGIQREKIVRGVPGSIWTMSAATSEISGPLIM